MSSHDRGHLPEPLTPDLRRTASTPPASAPTSTPAWAAASHRAAGVDPRDSPPAAAAAIPTPARCRAVDPSSDGRLASWRDVGRRRRVLSAVLAAGGTAALVAGPFAPAAARRQRRIPARDGRRGCRPRPRAPPI